jgi:hypothetical protein
MTASAAAGADCAAVGLQPEPEQVQHGEPHRDAPEERQGEPHVRPTVPLRVRVQTATVLSSVVAVQLVWLATIAYGVYWLLG